jgi:hypothetical protein
MDKYKCERSGVSCGRGQGSGVATEGVWEWVHGLLGKQGLVHVIVSELPGVLGWCSVWGSGGHPAREQ